MYLHTQKITSVALFLRDFNEKSKYNFILKHFFFLSGQYHQIKTAKVKGHLQRNSSIRSEEYRVVGDFEHSIGISRWAKLKQGPPCICVFAILEFSCNIYHLSLDFFYYYCWENSPIVQKRICHFMISTLVSILVLIL